MLAWMSSLEEVSLLCADIVFGVLLVERLGIPVITFGMEHIFS